MLHMRPEDKNQNDAVDKGGRRPKNGILILFVDLIGEQAIGIC
jgi:hypothetical protein